jgi:hypothetical protein
MGGSGWVRLLREKNRDIPPPPFLKISRIMGLAENSAQDLDVKELTYQAIENMEVIGATKQAGLTVTASVMIARISDGGKVGYHRRV